VREVFADTLYWVALSNPKDQWHAAALRASQSLGKVRVVTTEEVLVEAVNALSSQGAALRRHIAQVVRDLLQDPEVEVVLQSHTSL
jgi:predicted nucleic acid-binding protein